MKKYEKQINYIFTSAYVLLFLCCFISQDVYSIVSRFASLVSFLILGLLALSVYKKIGIDECVLLLGCIFTAAGIIIIHSNKGAFFTAADLLLMLYIVGKIEFTKTEKLLMSGSGAVLLLFWYARVRWDYNFNMAGLVFMVTCISTLVFFELLKDKYEYLKYMQVLSYFTALLFCILYHSRCAMMGMLIFGFIYLIYGVVIKHRWLQICLILLSTVGAVLFTLAYIYLGHSGFNLTILYKDILSGRQFIWEELWQELIKHPFTGVGSAYKLKSFFIFEVHNGLFDILSVHGFPVFICVCFLLIKKQTAYFKGLGNTNMDRIATAGIFAMLFTSFFENFFIVSPYLLCMFLLLSLKNNSCYD